MKKHELMLIVRPTLTGEERNELLTTIKAELGEILYEEEWGEREIAYPIRKQSKGFYVVYNFSGGKLHEIDEHLRLHPMVLRHLILSVPADYAPVTLAEVVQGTEALHDKKAKEREVRYSGGRRKPATEEESKKVMKPIRQVEEKPAVKEVVAEEPQKSESVKKEEPPVVEKEAAAKEPAPEEEKPKKEKKSTSLEDLDKKLDKIFEEDDLDLGF